ncbi:MAG TPA: hypothetical protein VGP93_15610 [Polyangiaceae bacterium]|nr:hypothetical protein [Polyangiaceae bacterium]
MCPVPPPGTSSSELEITELHDFGRDFEVFDLTYKLDDCALFRSRDTVVLRKEKVDVGKHVVPAGEHQLKVLVQFRSDFGADMHHYEWWSTYGGAVTLPPDGRLAAQARFYEEEAADPRQRMRFELAFKDAPASSEGSSSEAPPAASPSPAETPPSEQP